MCDLDFYKNLSYSNDIEYVEKNINLNISASEITKKNILDYGCGVGDATYVFNKLSPATITGIDIGESNIHFCENNESFNKNMLFIRADLNDYDLGVKKYDLIYSDTTIELLQKDVECILSDFKVAMKPNGVLYLSFTKKTLVNDIMSVKTNAPHLIDFFKDRARAFVQIQNGCDHRCTFCIIPYGRGNSRSVDESTIIKQINLLTDAGYNEIVLTGVDITSYGIDLPNKSGLGKIVKKILKE